MLLVLSSDELERLVKKYSAKSPKIEFLGDNSFKIKISGISISLFLEKVLPRKLSFIYKMNSVVNFFVEKFLDLEKPGILWDKEEERIELDFDQLISKDKIEDFNIHQLLIDQDKMILDFELKDPSGSGED